MGIPATWSGFSTCECYLCGTGFAMEAGLYAQRRADHAEFYCPNGHGQHFTGESSEQKQLRLAQERIVALQRDVARERDSRQWAERSARGAHIAAGKAKAAAKRLMHRVNCGVCP